MHLPASYELPYARKWCKPFQLEGDDRSPLRRLCLPLQVTSALLRALLQRKLRKLHDRLSMQSQLWRSFVCLFGASPTSTRWKVAHKAVGITLCSLGVLTSQPPNRSRAFLRPGRIPASPLAMLLCAPSSPVKLG